MRLLFMFIFTLTLILILAGCNNADIQDNNENNEEKPQYFLDKLSIGQRQVLSVDSQIENSTEGISK